MSQFDRQEIDGVVVFTVREPFAEDVFAELLDMLESEVDGAPIVVDLTPIPSPYYVSEESLSNLVKAYTRVSRRNGELALVGPVPETLPVLDDLFHMRTAFHSYRTLEEAIRTLRPKT